MKPMGFEKWMEKVDAVIGRLVGGLSHEDLADQTWRDWYNDGVTPKEAAEMALEYEGFFDYVKGEW